MAQTFEGGLFSGTLFADFYIDGQWTGLKEAGNATKFEIKSNAEVKTLPSKKKYNRGQILKSATIAQPTEIKAEINDPDRDVLRVGFLGKGEVVAVTPGSVTDEAHTAPAALGIVVLEKRAVSMITLSRKNGLDAAAWATGQTVSTGDCRIPTAANQHFYKAVVAGAVGAAEPTWPTDGTTVTDGGVTWQDMGPIEAELNADFALGVDNAHKGWVQLTETTRIEPGEPLLIDYTYQGQMGYRIKGATQPACRVRWFLDGENFATGEPVEITVYDTQTMPNAAIDFLSDNWQNIGLDITPVTPPDKEAPYEIFYPGR